MGQAIGIINLPIDLLCQEEALTVYDMTIKGIPLGKAEW